MGRLILFCVIYAAVTGLTSGVGVLPDSENKTVGHTVTFTPSLAPTDMPFLSITWRFGDVNIISSAAINVTNEEYKDRITLFPSTGSLELRNLTLSDSGDYYVNILTAGAEVKDGTTSLNIFEPVTNVQITASSKDLVESNDTVTLSCSGSGSLQSFLWFNGSAQLTASDRINFTDGEANVTIDPVLRYDQGPYSCEAFNPVSNDISGKESLSVSYGPEDVNLTAPSDAYIEGSIVPLSCSADSRPEALFKWLLNGEMLSDTGAQIDLVIKQSGNYSCQAFNSKTLRYTTSQPAELTVWKKIENSIVESSSNPPIEGSAVNLTCEASGSILNREWKFNGEQLKPSENIGYFDENRVLSFTNLKRKDSGTYTCNISNPVSSQSVDYTMKVNYGAENVKITGPKEIEEEATLTLHCSADSEPAAKYTWTKNGTILSHSQEYSKPNIAFSDSGVYICKATNEIIAKPSEASWAVKVIEGSPPNPCPPGCIAGIVIGVLVLLSAVAGVTFFMLKKKKQTPKSNSRTDGEGQDNSTYAQNQEVQYADVRFVKKGGQNNPDYAQVRKNNRPPASSLPSYEAHAQRHGRPAPEPSTLYADVRVK